MNKYIATFATFIATIILFSCNDGLDTDAMYPEKYGCVLYLNNADIVNKHTLYTLKDTDVIPISIIKTGFNEKAAVKAKLNLLSQAALDAFNSTSGTNYVLLPESCYSLSNLDLDVNFTPSDRYIVKDLLVNVKKIQELISQSGETYVLPIELTSETDSINAYKNILYIQPEVKDVNIGFKIEEDLLPLFLSKEGGNIDLPIELSTENIWDFDVQIEVDESALDDKSILMPKEKYQIANNGLVSFKKSDLAAKSLSIEFKDVNDPYLVVPLRIKSTTLEGLVYQEQVIMCGVMSKDIKQYPLKISNLSTNALQSGQNLANIIDGQTNTQFFTMWNTSIPEKHYIQIKTAEKLHAFYFSYNNASGGNSALGDFDIMVSADGENFNRLRNFSVEKDKLPTGDGAFTSGPLSNDTGFNHIRIVCNSNKGGGAYFGLSELRIFAK